MDMDHAGLGIANDTRESQQGLIMAGKDYAHSRPPGVTARYSSNTTSETGSGGAQGGVNGIPGVPRYFVCYAI